MSTDIVATGIEVRRAGPVATLVLDGAPRLNPIGTPTCVALAAAVRELEADLTVRAVVVQGAGRAFSAGADIDEIAGFADPAGFERFIHTFTDTLELLEASPLPFVAALHGAAMGGGLELALACDLRVVHAGGKLALPEAKLGVLPGAGGTQRLPRLLPRAVATEMIMLGTTITGARAFELGLANRCSDSPDAVLTDAAALADELAAGAALVPQLAKSLLRETATGTVAAGVVRERAVATALYAGPDGQEGFRAFVERRAPSFAPTRPPDPDRSLITVEPTEATMSESELVLREVADGVATLSFNRPDRNNAWSVPMELEYYRLLHECGADPEVRVIVVTGAGRMFCPGMDTDSLAAQAGDPTLTTHPHRRPPVTTPRSIRKPVIAAINGACAGIGLIAAMNCDLRFLSSAAKVTTSFVQRGIMAEHGLAFALTRVMSASAALDLLFSARIVQGQEALSLGLVDRVFEPDELMPRTLDYARGLAATSSPVAMGVIKQQVYEALESTQEDARTLSIRWWYDVLRSHGDFKEGVTSYLEKRPPAFAPWDPATPTVPAPLPTD